MAGLRVQEHLNAPRKAQPMPCKKHEGELEGRSDHECEDCYLADKAEEAYWRELYEGEKQAGLIPDPNVPPLPDPRTREWWEERM